VAPPIIDRLSARIQTTIFRVEGSGSTDRDVTVILYSVVCGLVLCVEHRRSFRCAAICLQTVFTFDSFQH
jgi:hypothetical protein